MTTPFTNSLLTRTTGTPSGQVDQKKIRSFFFFFPAFSINFETTKHLRHVDVESCVDGFDFPILFRSLGGSIPSASVLLRLINTGIALDFIQTGTGLIKINAYLLKPIFYFLVFQ
jgi:hypothetical protein